MASDKPQSLKKLEDIISYVQEMPMHFISYTPGDAAWDPELPKGHTLYSWGGEDDETEPSLEVKESAKPVAKPEKRSAQATNEPKEDKKDNETPKDEKRGKGAPNESNKDKGAPKESKKGKAPKPAEAKDATPASSQPVFSRLELRVGKILTAEKHSNADTMYVEQIDVGESAPRTICSGLVGKIALEELPGSLVVVVTNLKPANLRGIESAGMVLAASSGDKAALVKPPNDAQIGERVFHSGQSDEEKKLSVDAEIDIKDKKGIWPEIAPKLKTNSKGEACFDGNVMVTSQGPVGASSMPDSIVK